MKFDMFMETMADAQLSAFQRGKLVPNEVKLASHVKAVHNGVDDDKCPLCAKLKQQKEQQ